MEVITNGRKKRQRSEKGIWEKVKANQKDTGMTKERHDGALLRIMKREPKELEKDQEK